MPARFIPIGEPAGPNERQALQFLVANLPDTCTVYGNPWLVERSGVIYELDAVVVVPHAIHVVEIKSYHGRVEGTDHDWYLPDRVPSPIKLNRKTAQVLKAELRARSVNAAQVWVQGFVFLSAATDHGVKGPASRDRIHTRRTIIGALLDEELIRRLSGRSTSAGSEVAEKDLLDLFTGATARGPRPARTIREYEIVEERDHQETFTELLGRNRLTGERRLLRIYRVPPLADAARREHVLKRARWEAQVLGRLGRCRGILDAAPPFEDEAGIVLPLEAFDGSTLATWLERYGPATRGPARADLRVRTDLWIRIAQAIDEAHGQGVIHRLLRPDVVLVAGDATPTDIRVTGFDLAKQVAVDTTAGFTTLDDERLVYAAPEVLGSFSSAEPASDQFSLGAILALLLTGQALFENTRALLAARRLLRRVRDLGPRIPLSLDEAVGRMVSLRPTDRFPTLREAIDAVRAGRERDALPRGAQQPLSAHPERRDIDDLAIGTRLGPDYEVRARLGRGGMAVVYAGLHLVSGRTRALKIAHENRAAEDALRAEYDALCRLDHPNIVRAIDLTKMVEGRLTLVMERVGEGTLRRWIADHPTPDPAGRRRLAEDLLAGLDYLEKQGVTHKDLKPDNLLIGDGRLTIIDFSLAGLPEDAPYGGTALYRDPSTVRWSHGTDRYAAALCLFEIYAGRHAFEGRVPEPGEFPSVREDDISPPGLAAFFRRALHPSANERFGSAAALRDGLLEAIGEEPERPSLPPDATRLDAGTPLRTTGLSRRAVNALTRSRVQTVGELLQLSASQVRLIHAIGSRTAGEIVQFQESLRAQGVRSLGTTPPLDPPLAEHLADSSAPLDRLRLSGPVRIALGGRGCTTVGAVASLTRADLLTIPGIGRGRLAEVVTALQRFEGDEAAAPAKETLDRLWNLASRDLSEFQRVAVEKCVGLGDEPRAQGLVAEELGRSQPQVSNDCSHGIERLDVEPLGQVLNDLEVILDGFGGIAKLEDVGRRLEETRLPVNVVGAGLARLLVRIAGGRMQILELTGLEGPIIARPAFDRHTLEAFVAEVARLARRWPPMEPDAARRTLAPRLPYYPGDPLALAMKICTDVEATDAGHLFVPPVEPTRAIEFVLAQTRDPLPIDELERRVRQIFGDGTPYPVPEHLLDVLRDLDCQVQGDRVVPGRTRSVVAKPALEPDRAPSLRTAERTEEETVSEMLREAGRSRGFRMIVTPPERHAEIGRSVARSLGVPFISFEDEFLAKHEAELPSFERAERFVAQRVLLTEAAESLWQELIARHGGVGKVIVLGDTALLGLCEALDLPRRLYDETLSGDRGFWALIVPGVIHGAQPRFNEGPPMWHLQGATLPLVRPLPDRG
jgi:serine/threonine protein kinase